MIKIFKKFVYEGEFLEIDLKNQINQYKYSHLIFFLVFIKKILRNIYRFFQRILIKPSIRNKFAFIEIKIINFFSKRKDFLYNNSDLKNIQYLEKYSSLNMPDLLSFDQVNKIKEFLKNKKKISIHEKSINKKMPMDYYSTEELIENHEILNVINNEELIKIARGYFKCDFKLDWIWSWWSYADKRNESIGPQLFHRDYESLNFLKLFIYLTNVKGEDGSHQIIKSSNKINLFYKINRFSDSEIYSKFSKDDCCTIDGNAGKSFLANTYAIHRGLRPIKEDRLVLCYLLSTFPSRRSPKIPPIKFSEIKSNREIYLKNKNIFDLFINYRN